MRWLAALLAVLPPAIAAGQALECLSIDGQLRVDYEGRQLKGITVRTPAEGKRGVRTVRLSPADVVLKVLSETDPSVLVEGCSGQPRGTLAIVRTTTLTTRRVRLRLPDGGAFPADMIGRTAEGDAIDRELTCKRSKSVMTSCP